MVYYYLNRMLSAGVYLVLMTLNIYISIYLFFHLTGLPVWRLLPIPAYIVYLPQVSRDFLPMLKVLLPFGLFIVLLVFIVKLYNFMRKQLFKSQIRAYEKVLQARYEEKIHLRNRR